MPFTGQPHVRIARPSRDLAAAERFWADGLGLNVLYRAGAEREPGTHDLLMVGHPDASWHLELVHGGDHPTDPRPTDEDLLVLYLDGPVPEGMVDRLEGHGGKRVPSPNPYWNEWGVTVEDPDGYRLVLCRRGWSNS
ncbi:VOC family protein [Streptomyces sp. Ncost-T10-10d]|uniref:VOC family protein n=1 Tax=Streptomyces sp. Ncost-T10-10d TaxID=1839774 RepID=UPI00081F532E|nr:VOC family protein [Streptomyces sp. Ncost-T10-10d]SCF92375.1 Glyoxalase/Bleomycin resistance protein/Dioxygenase superfamily protein [Streptomyces sp. Ncost-T10-10d]